MQRFNALEAGFALLVVGTVATAYYAAIPPLVVRALLRGQAKRKVYSESQR